MASEIIEEGIELTSLLAPVFGHLCKAMVFSFMGVMSLIWKL